MGDGTENESCKCSKDSDVSAVLMDITARIDHNTNDKKITDECQWFVLENEGIRNFETDTPGTTHFALGPNLSFEHINLSLEDDQKFPLMNNDVYSIIPVCCNFCDCYGHLSRDCPDITPADGARRRICANCCSSDHTDHKQCPKKLCPYCFDRAHLPNVMCSKKHQINSVCYKCSTMGHEKAYCPENWRQYFLTVEGEPVFHDEYVAAKREYCSNCGSNGHSYGKCRLNDLSNDNSYNSNTSFKSHERRPSKSFQNNSGTHHHQPHNTSAVKRGNNSNAGSSCGFNRNMNRSSQNSRGSTDTRRRKYSSNSNTGNNKPGLLDMNNNTTPTNDGTRARVFSNFTSASSNALPFHHVTYGNGVATAGFANPLKLVYDFLANPVQKTNADSPVQQTRASLVGQINALRNQPVRFLYPGYQPPMSTWSVPISVTNSAVSSVSATTTTENERIGSPSMGGSNANSSGSTGTNAASSNLSNSVIAAATPVRLFVPSSVESVNVSSCTISCSKSETHPQADSATVNASSLFH